MDAPRYRIGNDLSVFWAIHNRDGSPFDMEGMDVRLFVTNERGRKEVDVILVNLPDGTINNVIRWDFKGEDQRVLGLHTLTVEISESESHREIIRDYCQAFELVGRSELETEQGDANISVGGDLILSSKLDIYRFEATNVDLAGIKESLHEINKTIEDISEESIEIKTTINGIQGEVNDIETELTTKASVDSVVEIGDQISEVQSNVAKQTIRVNSLEAEISTKASAESVTKIADELAITNKSLAEQAIKVTDLTAEVSTKASSDMVTELADNLKMTNDALVEQTLKVDSLSAKIETKASADSVTEISEGLKSTAQSVAQQAIKVTSLESEVANKASTESVTQIGDSLTLVNETVAEQKIRTDEIEASIENLVTKETFNAATGEIEKEFTSVKQTTGSIETTIQIQSGEIASITANVDGLSLDIGKVESDLDSLRNQLDGVTESFFFDYSPTNNNEPAATWIAQGKEADHKGDTFTNTSLDGDGAGKSWRWLQDESGAWGWHPIADTDAQKALVLASQALAAADGKVTIFYAQPSNYKAGDIWFVHNDSYAPYLKGEMLSAISDGTIFSLSDWEPKTRYSKAVSDLEDTMNTTFKDGVLDEAERETILKSLNSLKSEKSAIDAEYNVIVVNTDLTDTELKNEFKSAKSAYDNAYTALYNKVNQIASAKEENLEVLFGEYSSLAESYTNALASYTSCRERVNEALMGRLNPANVYLENITKDNVLTPVEKEQLFEIYRGIAKEYNATRGNAYNYKIWKYASDGITEMRGNNGGNGRYETYTAYKQAYNSIVSVFTSGVWGFGKMDETTTLPSGYTIPNLQSALDTYYEAYGELTEIFSTITASIEEAQKAAEARLSELTDILSPEEMSTLVGKGVVLSSIIATKDAQANITAAMNASSYHSDKSESKHGRIVFAGGLKGVSDWNDANFVVYEDGHISIQSADIKDYASISMLDLGLAGKVNVTNYEELVRAVNNLAQSVSSMWRIDGESLVTELPVRVENNLVVKGDTASGGEGDPSTVVGATSVVVDGKSYPAKDGVIDMTAAFENLQEEIDLTNYYTKPEADQQINNAIAGLNIGQYLKSATAESTYAKITSLTAVDNRLKGIETYFATSEDAGTQIDKWNEIVAFLNATEGTTLAGILATYYTKNEVDGIVTTINQSIKSVDDKYAPTKTWADTLASLIVNENGNIRIKTNLIVNGDTASGGGSGESAIGITGIILNGTTYRDENSDGIIDLGTITSGLTSVNWTDVLDRPTSLSQFNNDLGLGTLAYKNGLTASDVGALSTSGGTIEGGLEVTGRIKEKNIMEFHHTDGTVIYLAHNKKASVANAGKNLAIYNGVWNNIIHSGNIGDYALPLSGGTISGGLTITGNENNSISTVRNGNGAITNISGESTSAIRHAISFKWYDTEWQIGNVRGSTTNSLGFAITKNNDTCVFIVNEQNAWVNNNIVLHSGNIGEQTVKISRSLKGSYVDPFDANECYNTNNVIRFYSGFRPNSANTPTSTSWYNGLLEIALNADGTTAQLFFSRGKPLSYRSTIDGDWKTIAFTDSDITGKSGDSDKLGGNSLSWVQGNGRKFSRVKTATSSNKADANADLAGGGMIYSYSNPSTALLNGPSGMQYGHIWQIGSYGNDVIDGQLAWDINHESTEDVTRKLWWRARDSVNGWTYAKWHQIAFTDSNVASATKLATARTIWGQSFDGTGDILTSSSAIMRLVYFRNLADDGQAGYVGRGNSSGDEIILYSNSFLRFYAGAAERMRINSSGNVTIGAGNLAGTDAKLYVDGVLKVYEATSRRLYTRINSSSIQVGRISSYTSGYKAGVAYGVDGTAEGYIAGLYDITIDNNRWFFYGGNESNAPLIIRNNNVGIGTTNPQYKLDVNGTLGVYNGITLYGGDQINGTTGIAINYGSGSQVTTSIWDGAGARIALFNTDRSSNFYGAVAMASTLNVSGASTFKGNTSISGVLTLFSSLVTSGTIFLGNGNEGLYINRHEIAWHTNANAHKASLMSFSDTAITILKEVSINGATYANAGLSVTGALSVGGASTFNGDVRINGNLVVTGDSASGGTAGTTNTVEIIPYVEINLYSISVMFQQASDGKITQAQMDSAGLTEAVITQLIESKVNQIKNTYGNGSSYSYSIENNGGQISLTIMSGTGTFNKYQKLISTGMWSKI